MFQCTFRVQFSALSVHFNELRKIQICSNLRTIDTLHSTAGTLNRFSVNLVHLFQGRDICTSGTPQIQSNQGRYRVF